MRQCEDDGKDHDAKMIVIQLQIVQGRHMFLAARTDRLGCLVKLYYEFLLLTVVV